METKQEASKEKKEPKLFDFFKQAVDIVKTKMDEAEAEAQIMRAERKQLIENSRVKRNSLKEETKQMKTKYDNDSKKLEALKRLALAGTSPEELKAFMKGPVNLEEVENA